MEGCSWRDLVVLGDHNLLLGSIKIYNAEENCAFVPDIGQIPWTIAWKAGRYQKKHLLTLGRKAPLEMMRGDLQCFRERCKWRCQLGGQEPSVRAREMPSVRVKTRVMSFCHMTTNLE